MGSLKEDTAIRNAADCQESNELIEKALIMLRPKVPPLAICLGPIFFQLIANCACF